MKTALRHPEHELQKAIVAWHRACVPAESCKLIAIPNGDERTKAAAIRLLKEGMHPGATDLLLILPAGRTVWIEIKLEAGPLTRRTDLSDTQRDFRRDILALGHEHRVVRSIEQYEAVLRDLGVPVRTRQDRRLRPPAAPPR